MTDPRPEPREESPVVPAVSTAISGIELAPSVLKAVPEMQYAVESNASRYRAITRYLYEQSLIPRDWVPEPEILAFMRKIFPRYEPEHLEQDMNFLVEKKNVVPDQESTRTRSVEEFKHRRRVYQATPTTVALEWTLTELEQAHGNRGSLDSTLLERLWMNLRALDGARCTRPGIPTRGYFVSEMRANWRAAFGNFSELRHNATAFHAAFVRFKPEELPDIDAFVIYKDVLTQNLRDFINHLIKFTPQIRQLFHTWGEEGFASTLVEDLTHADMEYFPDPAGASFARNVVLDHYHREYEALSGWFSRNGGVEFLRRATRDNIDRVLRHASRLVNRHGGGASRRRNLERLAAALAACRTVDEAHRLAAEFLGCAVPHHLVGRTTRGDPGPAWCEPPQDIALRKVRRGPRAAAASTPIRNVAAEQHRVLVEEANRRAALRERWDRVFASGMVDLGELEVDDPELAMGVLALVGRCLASADQEGLMPDGRRVRLLAPSSDQDPGEFAMPHGVLLTPRFRLQLLPEIAP